MVGIFVGKIVDDIYNTEQNDGKNMTSMWESNDPNIQFMLAEYKKLEAEQEEVKRCGFRYNDVCWNCKKFFKKLRWKLCDNGYITYWCEKCY